MMIDIFLTLMAIAGIFPLLVGILTCFSWLLPLKPPADTSNRFNRIRIWWYGVWTPERFAPFFPWMTKDEGDNMGRHWENKRDD